MVGSLPPSGCCAERLGWREEGWEGWEALSGATLFSHILSSSFPLSPSPLSSTFARSFLVSTTLPALHIPLSVLRAWKEALSDAARWLSDGTLMNSDGVASLDARCWCAATCAVGPPGVFLTAEMLATDAGLALSFLTAETFSRAGTRLAGRTKPLHGVESLRCRWR